MDTQAHPFLGATGPVQDSEAALVIRAQLGDRAAMTALIVSTVPWLRPYLRRLLPDSNDADDVLQEALLVVFRRLALLDEPRAYRAWVYRVASRLAYKQMKRERAVPPACEPSAAAIEPADPHELAQIQEKISSLPPNTRAAVALHYYEQLSISRVAAVLGIPVGTAKSRIAAGLDALRLAIREQTP